MKHLLLTTIAAVVMVGCVSRMQSPVESIHKAAEIGNIRAVKQHLAAGVDVNDIDATLVSGLDFSDNGFATIK
jgi:PBP1b-binding outer membrane lipoprotein LpoB